MQSRSAPMVIFALLLVGEPAWAVRDQVPKFNIEKTCKEAQDISGDAEMLAYKGCMQDEGEARKQLEQNWSRFKADDRRNCVQQGAAPMPSYVEILTCIEMYDGGSVLNKGGQAPPLPTLSGTGANAIPPVIQGGDGLDAKGSGSPKN